MARTVQVRVTGPDAAPGEIAAADVARVILGLERALAAAAYLVLGRSRQGGTGRHTTAVAAASRLRFVGSAAGSFVGLLTLPDPAGDDGGLEVAVEDLGGRAFDRLITFLRDPGVDADAALAAAVTQLADDLGIGERTHTLTLGEPDPHRPEAVIDAEMRRRMRQLSHRPPAHRDDLVVGTLFEADFERRTARLRTPTGGPTVTVTFAADLAGDVQQALRGEAQLAGRVRYDRVSGAAVSIDTRTVTRAEQLITGDGDGAFTENLSVAELQDRQGLHVLLDPFALADDDLTDAERDAFTAALSGA